MADICKQSFWDISFSLKTLNKVKEEHCNNQKIWKGLYILNRLLSRQIFSSLFFLNCWAILKILAPHNKNKISNLVWNKNVSQVESIHNRLWNKFSYWNREVEILCFPQFPWIPQNRSFHVWVFVYLSMKTLVSVLFSSGLIG